VSSGSIDQSRCTGLLDRVALELQTSEAVSDVSARRMVEIIERFLRYAHGRGIRLLEDVSPGDVQGFLSAPIGGPSGLAPPSVATSHLRRSAVRLLFRVLRRLEVVDHDPTLDLVLPPRSSLHARPLTDDEIALCRSYSLRTLTETRCPAAWALAEASARTSEIPRITFADLELDTSRVWIPGSAKTEPRFGRLTAWGVTQLHRRRELVDAPCDSWPVIYAGSEPTNSGQASACAAISHTLTRSGLSKERDVRPISVAAWAGARVLHDTGRIEDAARALGLRSLDRTARILGWDWSTGLSAAK
jgi:integrase/recombinase XerC